jgi:hypothetical protein
MRCVLRARVPKSIVRSLVGAGSLLFGQAQAEIIGQDPSADLVGLIGVQLLFSKSANNQRVEPIHIQLRVTGLIQLPEEL